MCHIQIQNECCAQNIIKFFHSHLNNQADKKIYVAYVTGGSHKKKGGDSMEMEEPKRHGENVPPSMCQCQGSKELQLRCCLCLLEPTLH